jgi:hypothetical protein
MNRKSLIYKLGTAALVVGMPAIIMASFVKQEKRREDIMRNPDRFIEYVVEPNDGIDKLLKKYSNLPDSLDIRDVREYVKEINKKRSSCLYIGEKIKLPVYGKGK